MDKENSPIELEIQMTAGLNTKPLLITLKPLLQAENVDMDKADRLIAAKLLPVQQRMGIDLTTVSRSLEVPKVARL